MQNKKVNKVPPKGKVVPFISSIKSPLIIFISYTIFHKFFEILFTKIWVIPVASKIASSYYLDFLLLVGVILIVIRFKHKLKINFFLDNKHLFLNIVLLLTYIYYRFFSLTWVFLSTESFQHLTYMDIVAILPTINILQRLFYKDNSNSNVTNGFFFDNSLGDNGKDLLGRQKIASQIAKRIENTFSPFSSFSIGIVGEWGTGKTSFIDLIKRNLKDSVIIIDFNPWLSSSTSSISGDFFNILSEKLKQFNSSLSKDIKQYSDIVASTQNSSLNELFKIVDKLIESNQSLGTDFEKLNTAIKKIGRKVVVFVDDLDRLNKKEIFEVIRIIRNVANFSNLIFIAAYDRDYLINAIKKVNAHNAKGFLEKIFQLEIHLPKFEEERVKDKIIELLKPSLLKDDKAHLNDLLYPKGATYITYISKKLLISTLRDATRFVNSFLIVYELLKGEVYFPDLFRMELLRLKFPAVYQLVFLSKSDYFELDSFKDYGVLLTLKRKQNNGQKTSEFELVAFLKSQKTLFNLTDDQIDTIKTILLGIFPVLDTLNALHDSSILHKNAAAIPENFERYSHYRLLESDLSEKEFSKYWNKPLKDFLAQIDHWVQSGKGNRLRSRLRLIDSYSNREVFEKTIKSIFYFARIISDKSNKQMGFDGENLLEKIATKKEMNAKLYYNNNIQEYEQFIHSVFKEATSPYLFDIELIFKLQSEGAYETIELLPTNILNDLRLGYLKAYIKNHSKFDNNFWPLYRYCDLIIKRDRGVGHEAEPNSEAKKILIEFITKKDIDGFIQKIIVREPFDKGLFSISNIAIELFGNYDNLVKSLSKKGNKNSKYLEEFEAFIESLDKTSNSSKYTKFNFKIIPVNDNK